MRWTTYVVDCDEDGCGRHLESSDSMMLPRLMFINAWSKVGNLDFCNEHATEDSEPVVNWGIRGDG